MTNLIIDQEAITIDLGEDGEIIIQSPADIVLESLRDDLDALRDDFDNLIDDASLAGDRVWSAGKSRAEIDAASADLTADLQAELAERDPKLVPAGGQAGQLLTKASATDHDLAWIDPDFENETIANLALSTAWIDVPAIDLPSGSYIVSVTLAGSISTGILSWIDGSLSGTDQEELALHRSSDTSAIYLRTIRSAGAMKLQIAADQALASQAIVFRFRRMI